MTQAGRHRRPEGASVKSDARGGLSWLREFGLIVGLALVISFVVKTFFLQAFFIPSESMENTLIEGDRVVVNKLGASKVHRGDIVVFSDPGSWLSNPPVEQSMPSEVMQKVLTFVGILPQDAGDHLIKRVIGVGGDKIACCDDEGRVSVNGAAIDETYLAPGSVPHEIDFETVVPEGYFWVMGDNRAHSGDSRMHQGDPGGGSISGERVVGIAFVKVWPLNRFEVLRQPSSVFEQVEEP